MINPHGPELLLKYVHYLICYMTNKWSYKDFLPNPLQSYMNVPSLSSFYSSFGSINRVKVSLNAVCFYEQTQRVGYLCTAFIQITLFFWLHHSIESWEENTNNWSRDFLKAAIVHSRIKDKDLAPILRYEEIRSREFLLFARPFFSVLLIHHVDLFNSAV